MRRRVFIVAGEYSANPRDLGAVQRSPETYAQPYPAPTRAQMSRLFFRYPNRGDEDRVRAEDWKRAFGVDQPLGLADLLASESTNGA